MRETYAILWTPAELRQRPGGDDLVRRLGDITFGAEEARTRLSIRSLESEAAAELTAAEGVQLAPEMSTKLIAPCSSSVKGIGNISWGVAEVGAMRCPFTGAGVRVAVLDTGIERSHPAFDGVQIVERDFSGSGDGDRNGHGTHCAGTIFGHDVDGVRIGIAQGIRSALIGKVLRDDGQGSSTMIFAALKWAIDQNADVISMSLGIDFPGQVNKRVTSNWPVDLATSRALEDYRATLKMFEAIMSLARAKAAFGGDPLVVAAAGNESRRELNPDYRITASLPAVVADLSVGAVKRDGSRLTVADFSNSNPQIVAPGVDIESAWIGRGLKTLSGTSMACPHVAGVAALWLEFVRSDDPRAAGSTVRSHLVARARKDPIEPKANAIDIGRGLVTAP